MENISQTQTKAAKHSVGDSHGNNNTNLKEATLAPKSNSNTAPHHTNTTSVEDQHLTLCWQRLQTV